MWPPTSFRDPVPAWVFVVSLAGVLAMGVSLAMSFRPVNRDRAQLHALVACVENTSYTRDLLGQCLDDYKQAGLK